MSLAVAPILGGAVGHLPPPVSDRHRDAVFAPRADNSAHPDIAVLNDIEVVAEPSQREAAAVRTLDEELPGLASPSRIADCRREAQAPEPHRSDDLQQGLHLTIGTGRSQRERALRGLDQYRRQRMHRA